MTSEEKKPINYIDLSNVRVLNGSNKYERQAFDMLAPFFRKKYGDNFEYKTHYRPDWLYSDATDKPLELDIYIPKPKVAIEVMGHQHYEYDNRYFENEKPYRQYQSRDIQKRQKATLQGIIFITWQPEAFERFPNKADQVFEKIEMLIMKREEYLALINYEGRITIPPYKRNDNYKIAKKFEIWI